MQTLVERILRCDSCRGFLPVTPRPVVQLSAVSKVMIVGQAPGRRVHESGIPWNDASGRTLLKWLDVDEDTFYNPQLFSIMPMGFCYPGKGSSGDLPPSAECAPLWHSEILSHFAQPPLILLIGQYAQRYYLKREYRGNITDTIKSYQEYLPAFFPLPHPSPRNQNWIKINPWFLEEVVPVLREKIKLVC